MKNEERRTKSEEPRITMWTEIWFKIQQSLPSIHFCNLFSCYK